MADSPTSAPPGAVGKRTTYEEFLRRYEGESAEWVDGPADLAIEIVSPESRLRDRGEKYFEFERGGVPEFWLLDPDRQVAEFYTLSTDGTYVPRLPGADGVYRSTAVEGFWLRVEWLWEPPDVLDVAEELGLR